MIEEGRIMLNGEAVSTPATLLSSLHGVAVDGNPVAAPAPARLFLFHKPSGFLPTERDPRGRPTIYDKLPPDLPPRMPIGRQIGRASSRERGGHDWLILVVACILK